MVTAALSPLTAQVSGDTPPPSPVGIAARNPGAYSVASSGPTVPVPATAAAVANQSVDAHSPLAIPKPPAPPAATSVDAHSPLAIPKPPVPPAATPAPTASTNLSAGVLADQPAGIPAPGTPSKAVTATTPTSGNPAQPGGPSHTTAATTVVPGQTSPTTTSETLPRVPQPALKTEYWQQVQKEHPEAAAGIQALAQKYGISPERVAAHWYKENSLQPTTTGVGAAGEVGVMQIRPATREQFDPQHKLDPNSFWGSMELGARVIAQSDAVYGRDTVGSFAAYNAGEKGASQMYTGNGPAGAYKYAQDAFSSPIPLAAYHTYNGNMDGTVLLQTAATHGPDATIHMIANTGAPNSTLTDKWHAGNYAMVEDGYKRGGTEGAQAAMELMSQMSHAGSNAALMSAYKAFSSGDMTTAAQQLARAHTFFPDGASGSFGTDAQGNLWGQRFIEHTQTPQGQPFKVTREGLESLMVQTQDPQKFLKTLTDMRAANYKAALEQQRANYYAGAGDRASLASDTRLAVAAAGHAGGGGERGITPAQQQTNDRLVAEQQQKAIADQFKINENTTAPEDLPKRRMEAAIGVPVATELHRNGLPPATAAQYGRGVASGDYVLRPSKDGSTYGVYAKGYKEGDKARQEISAETAAQVARIAPNIITAQPAKALPPAKTE